MKKNKGVFTVLKRNNKNVIVYIEDGKTTYLDLYTFERNEDAQEYLKNHETELDDYITKQKDDIERKKTERKNAEERKKELKKEKYEAKLENKARKKELRREKREIRKEKRQEFWSKGWVKFTSGAVAMAIFLTGGHFTWVGISNLVEKGKKPTSSQTGTTEPTKDEPMVPSTAPIVSDELTDEKFEEITVEFGKIIKETGINLVTDDVVEFASIINIDKLCKDNPVLAQQLFSIQSKEEYLTETLKVLGLISQYNYDLYFTSESKGTTNGFIRVSDIVVGENEKNTMLYYESLVDAMAVAANSKDTDEVNRIAEEFYNSVNSSTSQYSAVPDGIGMGLYSVINAMINVVSRDVDGVCYLNQLNIDRLVTLSSCEKYISNIFVKYDGCVSTVSYYYSYEDNTVYSFDNDLSDNNSNIRTLKL